jgi:hypothetical protein
MSVIIAAPLTQLINKSLQQGFFSDALEIAKKLHNLYELIQNRYKNGRPVSVLHHEQNF